MLPMSKIHWVHNLPYPPSQPIVKRILFYAFTHCSIFYITNQNGFMEFPKYIQNDSACHMFRFCFNLDIYWTERMCMKSNYFLPFSSFWITCLSRINFYIPSPTYFPISSLLQDLIQSAFEDIISDELKKIEDSSLNDFLKSPASAPEANDVLWEYDGLHSVYQGECEEILLEMQRIFYEDYRAEPTRKGETWSHCFSLTHTRT